MSYDVASELAGQPVTWAVADIVALPAGDILAAAIFPRRSGGRRRRSQSGASNSDVCDLPSPKVSTNAILRIVGPTEMESIRQRFSSALRSRKFESVKRTALFFCARAASPATNTLSIRANSAAALVVSDIVFLVSCFRLGYMVVCPRRHLAAKKHAPRLDRASRMASALIVDRAVSSAFTLE